MKIKTVYESKIPALLSIFISIGGITIYPYIIYRYKKEEVSDTLQNHEMIHIHQQRELRVIGFYVLYVYYWLKNILAGQDSSVAYYNIPFEVEAYTNQHDLDYLSSREQMAWKKYIGQNIVS